MDKHADPLDRAADLEEFERDQVTDAIREAAANMPSGVAGNCDLCGRWSGRLVGGACAPCRDRYKLP